MEEGKSRMVSDAELIGRISDFLRSVDLKKTTVSIVRRKLEGDFGVDLSQKRPFIREQVEFFLYNHVQEKSDDEAEEDEDDDCGSDSDENSEVSEHEETGGGGRPVVLKKKKKNSRPSKGSDVSEPLENGGDGGKPVVLKKNPDGGPSSGKESSKKVNKDDNKLVIRSKSCVLSPQLQEFLGESQMLRFEVLNRLWDYVGQHNLIDPSDREKILCDEKLKELFGIDSFKICQMNTHLSKHLSAASSATKPVEKKKPQKKKRAEGEAELNEAEKRPKRVVTTGILSPSPISETFINFLGTGERALTRPIAIKRVWDYIKEHKLKKDPLNKRTVWCDEKLKELFEVDTFDGFTVPKLIQAHFVKQK